MGIKELKKLSDFMKKENLRVLEVSGVKLEKYDSSVQGVRTVVAQPSQKKSESGSSSAQHEHVIKSPLVGIFYAAPAPDAPPYVTVGKRIKKGDVLCIIEAMKQMNEIVADNDGTIAEVMLKSGEVVEFDQIMFRIN